MGRTPDETLDTLGGRKKLSEAEMEFMNVIWEHPEGISSEELYACFGQARGTKSTLLYRIAEKNYVRTEREGKHYRYFALVTRREYDQAILNQKLKKGLGMNSLEHLVAAFCGKERLTEQQARRVRKLLKEFEDE